MPRRPTPPRPQGQPRPNVRSKLTTPKHTEKVPGRPSTPCDLNANRKGFPPWASSSFWTFNKGKKLKPKWNFLQEKLRREGKCKHSALHYATLHGMTLHDTRHYTALHCSALLCSALHDTTRHDTTRHDTTRHDNTLHYTALHRTTRHDTTRPHTTQHHITLPRCRDSNVHVQLYLQPHERRQPMARVSASGLFDF